MLHAVTDFEILLSAAKIVIIYFMTKIFAKKSKKKA